MRKDSHMDWKDPTALTALVHRLQALPQENEWCEFKVGNDEPTGIGEYISALSNSATLHGEETAFLLWGIADKDHALVGTDFEPGSSKKGNEELKPWLTRLLDPQIPFDFHTIEIEGKRVVILRIPAAMRKPTKFQGRAYIRIGSYKKPLDSHDEHQRRLWEQLNSYSFEASSAAEDLREEDITQLLDYPSYFDLARLPVPESRSHILESLENAGLITHKVEQQWGITNAGALLYGKDLSAFPRLERKKVRVIHYAGRSRTDSGREHLEPSGYAAGFRSIISHITTQLPISEVLQEGIRLDRLQFPEIVIRELLANALIHQDLTMTGAGPLVEIFDDRLEITNPGKPLLSPLRFIDLPPRSRNEVVGMLMRHAGIAEERGSGWDKVQFQIELHQLPPAQIEVKEEQTRVTVFAPRPLKNMERPERVSATYQHACLRYVINEHTNNTSIRQRFGISDRNKAQASRIIKEAVDERLIVPYDPTAGPRSIRYVPFWAAPGSSNFVDD